MSKYTEWAFETIAAGIYPTDHVWKLASDRGMKCIRNTFWANIRNPVYREKIIVPPDEHNGMFLSDGKHTPLISQKLADYKIMKSKCEEKIAGLKHS